MIIYPALDLRGGKVVRLRGGDPAQQTIFGEDPPAIAERWIAAGAKWLHMVNLDGAFAEVNDNERIVEQVARFGVPIQFGGGLRSMADVQRAFDRGVRRVVLGTLALQQPDIVPEMIARWGADSIALALDARDGIVTVRGWQESAGVTAVDFGRRMAAIGVRHALYTDVSRDGALTGVNVAATVELAMETGLQVIASGGVQDISDVINLQATGQIAGVILGTALYTGRIDLAAALRVVGGN
jgi:phosphoribosylformimino-5-aminoimidazole carboxamide ribotide isomerase